MSSTAFAPAGLSKNPSQCGGRRRANGKVAAQHPLRHQPTVSSNPPMIPHLKAGENTPQDARLETQRCRMDRPGLPARRPVHPLPIRGLEERQSHGRGPLRAPPGLGPGGRRGNRPRHQPQSQTGPDLQPPSLPGHRRHHTVVNQSQPHHHTMPESATSAATRLITSLLQTITLQNQRKQLHSFIEVLPCFPPQGGLRPLRLPSGVVQSCRGHCKQRRLSANGDSAPQVSLGYIAEIDGPVSLLIFPISLSPLWLTGTWRPSWGRGPALFGAIYGKKTSTGATPLKTRLLRARGGFSGDAGFPASGEVAPVPSIPAGRVSNHLWGGNITLAGRAATPINHCVGSTVPRMFPLKSVINGKL